jgi:hypothetical protein
MGFEIADHPAATVQVEHKSGGRVSRAIQARRAAKRRHREVLHSAHLWSLGPGRGAVFGRRPHGRRPGLSCRRELQGVELTDERGQLSVGEVLGHNRRLTLKLGSEERLDPEPRSARLTKAEFLQQTTAQD